MNRSYWESIGPLNIAALPLSGLYAVGWLGYLATYAFGFKKAKAPHDRVLCVGNLRVGGTGKSPMVEYLHRILKPHVSQIVLGMSGYGSPKSERAQIAPDGELDPAEWGDEVAMMRWMLPSAAIIVGRARVRAAELCNEKFPQALLLMDDGFQHLPLKKSCNLILDPPAGNQLCFPAGPYREPRRIGLARADLTLPNAQFELVRSRPTATGPDGTPMSLPPVAQLVTAVARPSAVISSLQASGTEVSRAITKQDHDPLTAPTLLDSFDPSLPVIATLKDWVKLRRHPRVEAFDWCVTNYQVSVEPEEDFRNWLISHL